MIQFCALGAVPAAQQHVLGGPFAHAWKLVPCPAAAGAGRALCLASSSSSLIELIAEASPISEGRPPRPRALLDRVVGHHPLQALGVPPLRAAVRAAFSTSSAAATSSPRSRPSAGRSATARSSACFRPATPSSRRSCGRPRPTGSRPGPIRSRALPRPTLKSLTAVDRALMRASVVEVNKLEKRIPFLATTASIAPFIGLFGTVVGIMMAFEGIGQTGSTNLGVVAPGHRRSAGRDGGRTRRGHPGRRTSTTTCRTA